MSTKPIFVATHPRACSTAFERVFMTCQDTLQCAHEPFGDAFYYGPERLGERYADDAAGRETSGFADTTYRDVVERLERDGSEGKRVFVKDMAYYLMPPNGGKPSIAPSLRDLGGGKAVVNGHSHTNTNGVNGHQQTNGHVNGVHGVNGVSSHTNGVHDKENSNNINNEEKKKKKDPGSDGTGNPTVLPLDILKRFHWTFLIRHPRRGIPSYVRCCSPPLSETTGWDHFMPSEAGYIELRRLFEYLCEQGLVGPSSSSSSPLENQNGTPEIRNGECRPNENGDKEEEEGKETKQEKVKITVLDADDLLDHPEEAVRAFCRDTGLPFSEDMLRWDDDANQQLVADAFAKWNGWHNDAINSKGLTARTHAKKTPTREAEDEEWRQKYGDEGQRIIRACVDENTPHYEYLKSFALKF